MSTPWTPEERIAAYKREGITKIVYMPGWKTHNRDDETGKTFGPVHGAVIQDLVLLYALALLFVMIGGRLRVPVIVSLIATGIIAGPGELRLVQSEENVALLSEVGIALMLAAPVKRSATDPAIDPSEVSINAALAMRAAFAQGSPAVLALLEALVALLTGGGHRH